MKKLSVLPLALLALGACGDSPAGVPTDPADLREIVITQGVATPAPRLSPAPPRRSDLAAGASLGGSSTTPLSLNGQNCTVFPAQATVITYTVTGRQAQPASFQVNTRWVHDGTGFAGSVPTTVSIPPREAQDPATIRTVPISVENGTTGGSGSTSFVIAPFNVSTTAPATLSVTQGNVTVHVAFSTCVAANTAPWLVLPTSPIVVEATGGAGAAVSFVVTASDAEDGNLTSSVVCTPASGGTFALGQTTVNCSVTDSGGLSASGSFTVDVRDTTAPVFTGFPGDATLIAQNVAGRAIDLSSFGIAAEDQGPNGEAGDVSGPVSVSCKVGASDADGFQVAIGQTVTVSCTATDASRHPQPNTSAARTFDVFVTLDLSGMTGFLTPLRESAPYSAHKAGSTIPHKFGAPRYADGSLATDLAAGLRLVLTNTGNSSEEFDSETTADLSAGSTAWRWDPDAQQYVFNVKTGKTWSLSDWRTTASYAGIPLAQTYFKLNK